LNLCQLCQEQSTGFLDRDWTQQQWQDWMDASWGQTELREETEEGPDPDDVAVPWPKKTWLPEW